MSGELTIRDVIAEAEVYEPGIEAQQYFCGYDLADVILDALGLDPDTVLDRRCETCGGAGCVDGFGDCPTCNGSGRQAVNRVIVVPAIVAEGWPAPEVIIIDDLFKPDPEVEQALRIGRAVLASKPREFHIDDDDEESAYLSGWDDARTWFLAAGEGDQ